jgi:hypothetical protein
MWMIDHDRVASAQTGRNKEFPEAVAKSVDFFKRFHFAIPFG